MIDTTHVEAPRARTHGSPRGRVEPPNSLRGLYARYCDYEAMDLLSLVPPGEIRAFYRRAARWAADGGSHDPSDPLMTARRFAGSLLPLPPYEVWLDAYLRNRQPFLDRMGIGSVPRRSEPVHIEVKECGEGWVATLCVEGSDGRWRGFLQFHRQDSDRSYRTADIFLGEDAEELRSRFDSFDAHTLRAFLRSVLP